MWWMCNRSIDLFVHSWSWISACDIHTLWKVMCMEEEKGQGNRWEKSCVQNILRAYRLFGESTKRFNQRRNVKRKSRTQRTNTKWCVQKRAERILDVWTRTYEELKTKAMWASEIESKMKNGIRMGIDKRWEHNRGIERTFAREKRLEPVKFINKIF